MTQLPAMVELVGPELDAVAGGQQAAIGSGLIVVNANVDDVVDIGDVTVTLDNIANNNNIVREVGIGVAVAAGILGNAGALGVGRGG